MSPSNPLSEHSTMALSSEEKMQAELMQDQVFGVDQILKECSEHLNSLFNFETMAFFLVDETDQSFYLRRCEPATQSAYVKAECDHLIEQGFFSWALGQSKPVVETAREDGNTLILYALSTKSRIRGMFIAAVRDHEPEVSGHTFNLLSVVLSSTSNMLENHELYHCIREQNRQLEETIKQRTAELNKARVAAEQANEAKSQFLANISHEIRTPLTAIIGYTDLIRYGQLSSTEQNQAVQDILQASSHLSNIINDILDISKIEANKLDIERIPTPLFLLLDDVVGIVQGKAKKKDLLFNLDYKFPLPEYIETDPTRLTQILLNLCNNAIKFTEQGKVEISVNFQAENQRLHFSVIDTGIGIPEEQQDKLFEKFVQADTSTTRRYGGSGLGLAISKQLAQKLGGSISLQSAPGQGSRFDVSIDIGTLEPHQLIYNSDQIPVQDNRTTPWSFHEKLLGRVLLGEDNLGNQQLISLFLTKAGISVDVVDNGNEVVEKALSNDYDLILTDLQMPGMGGIEATKLLRDVGYGGAIVALTANATVEMKHRCHDYGFDGFLSKPIEVDAFFNTLNHYLKTLPKITTNHFDDPDFRHIQREFTQSLPETLDSMRREFQQQNWQDLKSLAHQLKGVAGGYGFPELGKTAGMIESAIERDGIEEIASLLVHLNAQAIPDKS